MFTRVISTSTRWHTQYASTVASSNWWIARALLCLCLRYPGSHLRCNNASISIHVRKRKDFLFLCLCYPGSHLRCNNASISIRKRKDFLCLCLFFHRPGLHVHFLCLCLCLCRKCEHHHHHYIVNQQLLITCTYFLQTFYSDRMLTRLFGVKFYRWFTYSCEKMQNVHSKDLCL